MGHFPYLCQITAPRNGDEWAWKWEDSGWCNLNPRFLFTPRLFHFGGVLYILVAYVCVSVGLSWDDDFTPIYRENEVSNGGFWTVLEWTPIEILAKLEFPIKPGGTRLKFFTSLVPSGKLEGNKLLEGNSPSNHHL